MVAEIQRLENAARVAMGDIQAPDQIAPQRHPIFNARIALALAALAAVGVGLIAFSLV